MSAAKVASPASLGNDHSVSEQALPDAGNEKAALSARDYASGRLKKAESRFNKKRKTLNLENQAEIERHFEEANKFRTLASVEYDAGAFGESVSHYKKAANEADYIYIVLQAKDDLKFDVIRGITEEAKVETVKGDASSEVTEPVEGASKSEKSLDATRENPTKVRNKERNSDQADQESVTSER
jgi:hypothetical protein